MRYVVINYRGSHSISRTDRDLMGYEFSDNLEYLRKKYLLNRVVNYLDWRIDEHGFSIYMIKGKDGILLVDMMSIKKPFKDKIDPLIDAIDRDQKLNNILNI